MLKKDSQINFDDLFGHSIDKGILLPSSRETKEDIKENLTTGKHNLLIEEDPLFKKPHTQIKNNFNGLKNFTKNFIDRENYKIFDERRDFDIGIEDEFEKYYHLSNLLKDNILFKVIYQASVGINPLYLIAVIGISISISFFQIPILSSILMCGMLYSVIVFCLFLCLRSFLFKRVYVNWIGYMRYVLKNKHGLNKEDVDDITELLIYENNGIQSSCVNTLLRTKTLKIEWKIVNWIQRKKMN